MRKGTLWTAAALIMTAVPAVAHGGEMSDNIWSGEHGGIPSITANAQSGVSMTLPAQAVEEAGGGSIGQIAKSFLDRWAPGMCSDAFDFQSAHKGLKVEVALIKRGKPAVIAGLPGEPCEVSTYRDVIVDYEPSRKVNCVRPEDLTS